MTTVRTGARLHLGFRNLSLAHERLYGGVGLALAAPAIELRAERHDAVDCDDEPVTDYVAEAVNHLGVPGARISVETRYERHVGLGSGTQLALACLAGVASVYGRDVDLRSAAPALGRGGRSGVGVATFERGGLVVDAGHATERFTSAPPPAGEWKVPNPIVARPVPADWRFVLVTPDAERGPSGASEDDRMRSVVERADPGIADEIATLLTRRLLPAVAECDHRAFGAAAARFGRLNGAWYADEQGGVYRPPAGRLVEALGHVDAIAGAGQTSWGPTVYGVTHEADATAARAGARDALDETGLEGRISVAAPRNGGALIDD